MQLINDSSLKIIHSNDFILYIEVIKKFTKNNKILNFKYYKIESNLDNCNSFLSILFYNIFNTQSSFELFDNVINKL